MATAHDVAAYILRRSGDALLTYKLQKLTYYAQAWSMVWEGHRLFDDRIEAWPQGPVVRSLYPSHRKQYRVHQIPGGNAEHLTADEVTIVDAVLAYYGRFTGDELVEMTHQEQPWLIARGDLAATASSNAEVTVDAMLRYYSRQQATGAVGPRLPVRNRRLDPDTVQAEVRLQMARWQEALDRMDKR